MLEIYRNRLKGDRLFLFVRRSICVGHSRATNETCKDDHGSNVRSHTEQVHRNADLQQRKLFLPRVEETKYQRSKECTKWIPVAKDHGCQAEKSFSSSHALVKASRGTDAHVAPGQSGNSAADQDAD